MKLLIGILAVVGGATWLLRNECTSVARKQPPKDARRKPAPPRKQPLSSKSKTAQPKTATTLAAQGEKKPGGSDPANTTADNDVAIHTPSAGYLDQILSELDTKNHALERHDYLSKVVDQAYKERANKGTAKILEYMAELHIKEFPKISPALKKANNGTLPRVPTFQKYAIYLSETGAYQRAIDVCKKAIEQGLSDGTKGDFPERIKRILKKQTSS